MTDAQQRAAAKAFAKNWKDRGYEKGDSQIFWVELLTTVFGVTEISQFISFEDQVHLDHTSFIDGYIEKTHVMIEQKSINKSLTAAIRQSDGSMLTPFEQAKRYSSELPYSKRPRWIVTSNFQSFYIYDMEKPGGDPEIIQLENLEKEYYRLQFLVDAGNTNLQREMEVSIAAGEIVGLLYDMEITQDLTREREISRAVFSRISDDFHVRVPDTEVDYFALYMLGRSNFVSQSVISQEVDDLVLEALREIRSAFNIDLTNDVNLRIALELHCTPMLVRVRYDMQMKNHLVYYIRQTFPQGFDIATFFASVLQKRLHKKIQDEEIAFIAIHLYKALTDLQNSTGTRRVLVISSLRRSENILIRQTLYKWFSDQIAELFFLPPSDMNESYLERYDTFLTTEKGKYYDMGLAFYINPFPDRHDYLNLKLAMDGFESINDILQIFHQDLFMVFPEDQQRDDILRALCEKSSQYYQLEDLHDAVLKREALGSTLFSNHIAAPHPLSPVSSDTFISIGVIPQAVEWDGEGNKVHLVMLVSVGKNNAKAFQIWNYLSKIFMERRFVPQLLANPTYENFLKLLKDTISQDFSQ